MICINHEICMFARMSQAAVLFLMVLFLPVKSAARGADREGCIQKDQEIRLGDLLPHGLYVGMFLRDVRAGVIVLLKPLDQRGLARTTGTYNTDKQSFTWRLHKNSVVTISVVR